MHLEEHRRQMCQYVLTVQQLSEREVGVKLIEDDLMMHRVMGPGLKGVVDEGVGRGSGSQ
jgi:hypothetical protein